MQVNRIDHLVLTVASIERTVDFYTRGVIVDLQVEEQRYETWF